MVHRVDLIRAYCLAVAKAGDCSIETKKAYTSFREVLKASTIKL